jgi:hypothetical protein
MGKTRKAGRWSVAAVILGAFAFGATQALASTPRGDDCQPCATTKECNQCCIDVLHLEGGVCFPPVCLCL